MLKNRIANKTFETQLQEVAGRWRKLHSEEIPDLYTSLDIIVAGCKRMSEARYVPGIREKTQHTEF